MSEDCRSGIRRRGEGRSFRKVVEVFRRIFTHHVGTFDRGIGIDQAAVFEEDLI